MAYTGHRSTWALPYKNYTRPPKISTSSIDKGLNEKENLGLEDVGLKSPGFHRMFGEEASRNDQSLQRSPYLWTSELLSLLLGVVCMLVIVIVLGAADGRRPPQWPLGVTLNTLLAFLASFSKIAFMIPIVEGLGQLKWMWFMSPNVRPLGDFQVFDEASRGACGCFKLLLQRKGLLACLAALISVSGILSSTLTQQAIDYQQLQAKSAEGFATINRATAFSLYNGSTLVIPPWEAVREKQAIVNGAFFVPNETLPHGVPNCSSGHCTWEPYGSIALCSEVVNITETADESLIRSLTNMTSSRVGALFDGTSVFMGDGPLYSSFPTTSVPPAFPVIISPLNEPTGTFNDTIYELLVSDHVIAYSDSLMTNESVTQQPSFHFLEVGLYWCTKTLSSEVNAGVAVTTELGTTAKRISPVSQTLNFAWSPQFYPCYTANTCNETFGGMEIELQAPPNSPGVESYRINVWTSLVGSVVLGATMYDSILMDFTRGIVASTGGGIAQAFASSLFGDYMNLVSPPPETQFENVKGIASNMAQSLTNFISDGDTRLYADSKATATVVGTVYTSQTFVKIHWEYIGVLASQIFLTSLFLAGTIISTQKSGIQILKGSSIAALCGLEKDTRRHLGDISDFEKLRRRARQLSVRLERGSSGIAFWLGMVKSRPTTLEAVELSGGNEVDMYKKDHPHLELK